jgi:prephenate dehydrogenase
MADCVARALRHVATCVIRPTSATATNVAANSRVMLGVPPVRMGLHNTRVPCTFQAVRPHTLGLIGLGAIGGSVARQAKRAGAGSGVAAIIGWSPEPAERAAAAQQGALDDAPARASDVARAADLVILAAPPAANLAQLEAIAPHLKSGSLVTDVGSVKRAIVERAERLGLGARFAGSHPLAGTHRHGFEASRSDLFRHAVVYITPCQGGVEAASEIAHFWESVLEAQPVMLDAARHDTQVAATSHLPQIVASLLGEFLARHAPPGASFGTGAMATTRLAASEPRLWTEILLMNRDELLPALRGLEESLGSVERALETGDAPALTAWLTRASDWRRRFGESP